IQRAALCRRAFAADECFVRSSRVGIEAGGDIHSADGNTCEALARCSFGRFSAPADVDFGSRLLTPGATDSWFQSDRRADSHDILSDHDHQLFVLEGHPARL